MSYDVADVIFEIANNRDSSRGRWSLDRLLGFFELEAKPYESIDHGTERALAALTAEDETKLLDLLNYEKGAIDDGRRSEEDAADAKWVASRWFVARGASVLTQYIDETVRRAVEESK